MSNTGLSSLSFMDGLMKGATFMNGFQQQKRANDIEDKKLTMAETAHNQQTKLNDLSIQGKETEALLKDFDRDTRLLAESGKAPDEGFLNKYSRLLRPVSSEENRLRQIETYKGLKAAVDNDDYGPDFHKYMNMALKDRFDRLKEMDGLDRQFIGAKEVPTGYDDDGDGEQDTYMVPVLQVTRPDGTKYLAPYTKNGTADPDDDVVLFNDDLMNEFLENMRQRAELATEIHQFSDDPVKQIAALRRGVLGPQEQKDAYEVRDIYDEATGTKRAAAIRKSDASFSHWLGGASVNDGRGGSGSGSGRGGKAGVFDVDGYLKMQQEIRTSANFATPEERAAAAAEVDRDIAIKWGVPPEVVLQAHQLKRQAGDYSELTHEDVAQVMAGIEARQRAEADIDNTMAANPEVFGRPGLQQLEQQVAQNSQPQRPPMPGEIDRRVTAQIQELEAKAADPRYPENARAKFQSEAEKLRGKNTVAAVAPPKPATPRERRQHRIEQLQQMIAAGPDSLKAAEYVREMAQLMAENNAASSPAAVAGL